LDEASFGDTFKNYAGLSQSMVASTICIPAEEYALLKKKEAIADNLLLQLEASLHDLKAGRVRRVR